MAARFTNTYSKSDYIKRNHSHQLQSTEFSDIISWLFFLQIVFTSESFRRTKIRVNVGDKSTKDPSYGLLRLFLSASNFKILQNNLNSNAYSHVHQTLFYKLKSSGLHTWKNGFSVFMILIERYFNCTISICSHTDSCLIHFFFFFHFLSFTDTAFGLRDVHINVPLAVRRGDDAHLLCNYNLENDTLYSVKWYKGRREFYRYLPKENPAMKLFPLAGINVEVSTKFSSGIFYLIDIITHNIGAVHRFLNLFYNTHIQFNLFHTIHNIEWKQGPILMCN